MPVEIRELVIRATVDDRKKDDKPSGAKADPKQARRVVEDCLDQVSELLRRRAER